MCQKKEKPSGKDSKEKKPKQSSSSTSKNDQNTSSYTDGINFPPQEVEEEGDEKEGKMEARRNQRSEQMQTDTSVTDDKKQKKLEKKKKERLANAKISEDLKNDRDAFTVVIGSKASVLEGEDTADANVQDISTGSFSVSVCGKELMKNVSLKLSHGRRYGFVGKNGTGKSSLLKLLEWRMIPVPKNISVLLVDQEVPSGETSALDLVVSANEELVKLREEDKALQKDSSSGVDDDDSGEKLAELYKRLEDLGSDSAEPRASKILAGLGFTNDMQVRATQSFSGGWRMRISLARALFMQPSLLLLDEPTNHLDHKAVSWLEEYLCSLKKTLVVVSHNPDFLNKVCTNIIHLHDKSLDFFRGNHDDFKFAYEKQCNEVKKKFEIQRKRDEAAKRSGNKAQQEKFAERKTAKGKTKGKEMDEEGPTPLKPPRKLKSIVLDFPEPTKLPDPLLKLKVSFWYTEKPEFKLLDVDLCINMGTRVAIVGPNGAGKSTLLKLIAGDLVPTEGEVLRSQKLRIGMYSQHFVDQLTMEETPVKYLLRLCSDQEEFSKEEPVRAKLGKFGLPGHRHVASISELSGGEKARVVLASISMSKPHILLLDEPTNHLDEQTKDALAKALDEFTGGVVLVSHEPGLVSLVCKNVDKSEIWVVEDGTVTVFPGSYEEYKENL
ncbi:hypothetical protein EUTSA_v10011003mg [Eutrema salsugineum]|uniref:ABC transporter domain-containing protein n=1 Tax=Eutrema salsugineum TaxID=72664 RepID=V4L3Y6_EUTSA|nr:ABC transporter F family member 4 [Eutrema salsugineum]ESQ45015.1 hypothetical protein EUTSA_v10011003mg [Eutrema salsugineum]